ncbi:BREX system P-loop protein BrxC [Miniphocaeibacter halophilus]|uniref:BREX system P-loop protein BrxC n=1 Tax=Miniphocaeibacter halophilus TaxID=2931922 RepID=A0AC61MR77_9FIRM|nr:BREX system P-loop protein BrxC [Miniphocaeibacter halophilus]QQK06964.1 BREX system P-loop protein BrxC [Miniphocaeibacter halophilus]
MLIKDMFTKDINRDIQGVIKVGQDNVENIKQELEEYVVTDELQKHFRDFFTAYVKGINGYTDKMGVWISGFFGSGKSHLLKILSYLISNKEIEYEGEKKKAIDIFLDDNKINDPMVVANMKLASQISTDSILFNIDSRSDTGTTGKEAILSVFLKVFNEMQGYSETDPYVADLERWLEKNGKYDSFKAEFEKITGDRWKDKRYELDFLSGELVEALVNSNSMTEESAEGWYEKITSKEYSISISEFAELVNKYIEEKGNNHHVVFFVDEVGQYIGDNRELMLNLQTVVEDLGTACKGKAWVVVTSQEAIDQITVIKGDDFSKIQGRFDTRINLTSADVSEVIEKRILEKNDTAKDTLSILYKQKQSVLDNLIIFNDSVEKKKYENVDDFVRVYPFIPYQFNLLSNVLTAIRQFGASGKHLSEGERSMLAMFKESAQKVQNEEDGVLVSFDKFYNALSQFLDSSHARVVSQASRNKAINPEGEENCFNVNVLKTLFMVKYVKEITATVDNITTLMASNIDEDRLALKEKVQDALNILKSQTLIQQNGDIYIFLTDEEQEVERLITKIDVRSTEISKSIGKDIFDDIYINDKYIYPEFGGRYTFSFNKEVDEIPIGNQLGEIFVKIITPSSEYSGAKDTIKLLSSNERAVYVELPSDESFLKEKKQVLQIESFLVSNELRNFPKSDEIKGLKSSELKEYRERSKRALEDALKNATYYVEGEEVPTNSMDFKSSLTKAIGTLVKYTYNKLDYITATKDISHIRALLNKKPQMNLDEEIKENELALRDLEEFISLQTLGNAKVSIRDIKNKFSKAPYGFVDYDISWLIAKLFMDGKLEFTVSGNSINLLNTDKEVILDYITKKKFEDKVLLSLKKEIDPKKKKNLKDLYKLIFNMDMRTDESDGMTKNFKDESSRKLKEIERLYNSYFSNKDINIKYPGKEILKSGEKLFNYLVNIKNSEEFFDYIYKNRDEFEDFVEDFEPVQSFFGTSYEKSNQIDIWKKAFQTMNIYEDSKNFVNNSEIEEVVGEINHILKMDMPFNKIKDLPDLRMKFLNLYAPILEETLNPVLEQIKEYETRVSEKTAEYNLNEEFENKHIKRFKQLVEKAESYDNLKDVYSVEAEANTIFESALKNADIEYEKELEKERIRREKERQRGEEEGQEVGNDENIEKSKLKKQKTILFRNINPTRTWKIEKEEDLDNYLQELKNKIKSQIQDEDIINIEF